MQGVLPLKDEEFEKLAAQLRATGVPALSGYNVVPKGPVGPRPLQRASMKRRS